MDCYISMIVPFGCNFVVRNFGACSGGLVPISQNNALFSLLGTMYGGDGRTTFGLPDLRGRSPISWGHGPGLDYYVQGAKGGVEDVSLTTIDLPPHNHSMNYNGVTDPTTGTLPVSSDAPDTRDPDGSYLTEPSGFDNVYATTLPSPPGAMGPVAVAGAGFSVSGQTGSAGAGQPVYTRSPYQAIYYQICMFGLYPSRS